ncbi:MAG TPA: hypothetical protein VJ508_06395, partial [Saprospiraceae bacterium]|nr:hypothetical protein [Saprospiraceae bacterium]
ARLKINVAAVPATPTGIIGDSVICPGQTYGFTIDPSGAFTTHWTITDGLATLTSQGQSLDYTFGATPPFQISAYNSDLQYPSCVSGSASILLHTPADSQIEGPGDGCINGLDDFSFPLISGADYHWEVVPSSSGEVRRSDLNKVQIFWTQSGPAMIRLTVCGTVIDKPVTIHPLPVFSLIGPPAACPGELITFQSDQPAMLHTWLDENENLMGHADTIAIYPGTYALELQDQFGCTDRKSFSIGTYPVPVVNLTTSDETFYCGAIPAGVTVTANTDGGGYTFEWFKDDISQGIGGPIFNITDFAMYDVEVTNSYGCKAKSPKVNFSACCPVTDCNG